MAPIFMLTLIFPLLANGMTEMFTGFFETNGADDLPLMLLPLLPMIVGFFPVSISLVIALETFVGEKERLSLEPLLSTPLTNTELYLGKSFAAMLPPLMASYAGMTIYILGLVWGEQQWRPEPLLVVQIVLLTTAQALVMVTGAVVVSSQRRRLRARRTCSPASSSSPSPCWSCRKRDHGPAPPPLSAVVYHAGFARPRGAVDPDGRAHLQPRRTAGRALDQINLRWAFRTVWAQFRGPVGDRFTLGRWYRLSVFPALASLRTGAARSGVHRRGVCGRLDRRRPVAHRARPVRGERRNADRQPAVVVRLGQDNPNSSRWRSRRTPACCSWRRCWQPLLSASSR